MTISMMVFMVQKLSALQVRDVFIKKKTLTVDGSETPVRRSFPPGMVVEHLV